MSAEHLTHLEGRVLAALATGGQEFGYFSFKAIGRRAGIDQRHVRATVRRLARFELAKFGRGLFTEDGDLYGSGYAITPVGRAAVLAQGLTAAAEACDE